MTVDTSPLYPHRRDAGYGVDCRCAAKSGIVRRDGELWGDHCPVAMREEIARLKAELAEALATLANERGEGEPPCEGWRWNPHARFWHCGTAAVFWADYARVWWWDDYPTIGRSPGSRGPHKTARAAIRDASAAKGGAR